jgi:hypothetical protein
MRSTAKPSTQAAMLRFSDQVIQFQAEPRVLKRKFL